LFWTNSAYAANNNIKSNVVSETINTHECHRDLKSPCRDFEPNCGGYGGAIVPVSLMYGSELYGTTEVPNSESHVCKAKVSTSKCHKAKLSGSKAEACLSYYKTKKALQTS